MRWAGCAHDRRGRRPLWRAREPTVAAQSEPVKGALVPAGKGMKIASMSGAKEPYIPSAEAVEFSSWLLGRVHHHGANRSLWTSPGSRIPTGKVGSRRAVGGLIDPGTTVNGINAERTSRLYPKEGS